jgi:hypothetical protein
MPKDGDISRLLKIGEVRETSKAFQNYTLLNRHGEKLTAKKLLFMNLLIL